MFQQKPKFLSTNDLLHSVDSLVKLSETNKKKSSTKCCGNDTTYKKISQPVEVKQVTNIQPQEQFYKKVSKLSQTSLNNKKNDDVISKLNRFDGDYIVWVGSR